MKVFDFIYPLKKNDNKIQMLDARFVNKNRNHFKIIFKNKLIPLQKIFSIINEKTDKIKIKLVCYSTIYSDRRLCRMYNLKENHKYKRKINKYYEYLKCSFHEMSNIRYYIDNVDIKIFGKKFVDNNRNKNCIIIYKDKLFPLKEYFSLKDIDKDDSYLEIYFLELNEISDRSYMFHDCELLQKFPLFRQTNKELSLKTYSVEQSESTEFQSSTKEHSFYSNLITTDNKKESTSESNKEFSSNTLNIFKGNSTLLFSPNKSKWNTCICTNMSNMFKGCKYLRTLPDISQWDTQNVIDMSSMFEGCSKLISIPDISQWKINKVRNISSMFKGCSNLKSIPDISLWNTNNINNMSSLFMGCSLLKSLPDISLWNINNVNDFSFMFQECKSLKSLPDISKWNPPNLLYINNIFEGCLSLISLPNISNWDTNKVNNMDFIFKGCSKLQFLSDISNWNINNVKTMKSIFCRCHS